MVCQDKGGPSTVSPKETCSSWGSFQTAVDNTVPSPAGMEGYRSGLSVPPGPLHVQSSRTLIPAQHFRATWVVFTEWQQLLHVCIHEGQSQELPPTAPEQVFHLQPVCSHCRGPGDDFYGGQALECSYC